jgi:voltage-gated potassium channel
VGEFFDSVVANELGLRVEQVEVNTNSPLIGKNLGLTTIRSELDVIVISIRRHDGEVLFNPSGDTTIEDRDLLIAIGRIESLIKLNQLARGTA